MERQALCISPSPVRCFVCTCVRVCVGSADATELFCVCRTPYDNDRFYLGCESCENWFHGKCVNITEEEVGADINTKRGQGMQTSEYTCTQPVCICSLTLLT